MSIRRSTSFSCGCSVSGMTHSKEGISRPALLKIGRAEYHINDLNRQIDVYLSQKPLRLMTEGNPSADEETHFIEEQLAIPDGFSLSIGDAVHNLRSALDILIFGMIGHRAKKPENVQFPFAKREDSLVSTMQRRETELAGEKVVAEIKALKPYVGGDVWLSSLHALDIADKHKLIIPVASTARMSSLELARMIPALKGDASVEAGISQGAVFRNTFGGDRATRRANRRNIRPGKYERNFQPTFEICFGEDQPFSRQPVVPTLVTLANKTNDIVIRLADAFVSQGS